MKSQILTALFLCSFLPASSQNKINVVKKDKSLVNQLGAVEKAKNSERLKSLFSADAVGSKYSKIKINKNN